MSKDVAMIAISTDNTSAFIVNDGKLLLLTPPYLASDQIEVTENDIGKALQLAQFKECDHKFDNMKEAISFLENQYIEMLKGFGDVKPSTENFKELLKYADEDVYINYLKRTKNELIPNRKFDIAGAIAIDIMDLNKGNPDIKNMALDILREIMNKRNEKPESKQIMSEIKLSWSIKYRYAIKKFPQEKIETHSRRIGEEKRVFNIVDKAA